MDSFHEKAFEIIRLLREKGSVWHRTSISSFKKILESEAILPNNGSFDYTYSQSANSLGKFLNSVSLFDFNTASEIEIIGEAHSWLHFMNDQSPLTVLIEIDRSKLDPAKAFGPSKILPVEMLQSNHDGEKFYPTCIAHVELLNKGAIPLNTFRKIILIKNDCKFVYKTLELDQLILDEIEKVKTIWVQEIKEYFNLEAKSHNMTLSEYLMCGFNNHSFIESTEDKDQWDKIKNL